MTAQRYADQVSLLVRAIPEIAHEEIFALKGGTAINLFVRDLPRLSVDIDLVYLPVADRDASLQAVRDGLERIAVRLERSGRMAVERRLLPDGKRLIVQADGVTIKIEVSPVLRGTVFAPTVRSVSAAVENRFGFAEMQLVSEADLYAGKIAAALDRQHPRDLFDIHFLFANEGISNDLFKAFLIYLVSHPRPAHELLCPHRLDISAQYSDEFLGMTVNDLPLDALLKARERLIAEILSRARLSDARRFLTTFHQLSPDWDAFGFEPAIADLPALRWKSINLEKLREQNPSKFEEQLRAVDQCLDP
ncbi:nucleotidyl transferase AbiEii/AbiGii toxin family protein [Sphingomonas paeninsulae]|uniref:Nucleotidyl transferase AbiEii/AbiGii toxin family protein n=1 Tax=Sphingomonas paeninsulae TaxID=2319844 RepID=A0A494TMA2_SPHPE|nr:nucleotidyl transferase AbiEii/AbiGii toxin family protein [Sphingomonas paeninsulae]AYJ86568.1 nucleotidyl transferase AbiEii/AbiGii toxin family protein [Sphingomonas paeninsulae]